MVQKNKSVPCMIIRREMSISHRELLRLLPAALGGMPWRRDNGVIIAHQDGRRVRLELSPETSLALGALKLPVTRVRLELSACSEVELHAFMHRFDLVYQRGGG